MRWKNRLHRFEIEKRLVDVEDDQGKGGPMLLDLLFAAPRYNSSVHQCFFLSRPAVRGLFWRGLPQIAMLHHRLACLRV